MRAALAAEECVEPVPLWKLARVESVCNVGHRRGKNGLAGLDGCCDLGEGTLSNADAGDDDPLRCMMKASLSRKLCLGKRLVCGLGITRSPLCAGSQVLPISDAFCSWELKARYQTNHVLTRSPLNTFCELAGDSFFLHFACREEGRLINGTKCTFEEKTCQLGWLSFCKSYRVSNH